LGWKTKTATAHLVYTYINEEHPQHQEISQIGDFILAQFDQTDLNAINTSKKPDVDENKSSVRSLLMLIAKSYSLTNNKIGFEKAETLLKNLFKTDKEVIEYLDYYKL